MCNLLFLCDCAHTKTMTITVFFYERQWRMQELTNGGGGGAPILSRIYTFCDPERGGGGGAGFAPLWIRQCFFEYCFFT